MIEEPPLLRRTVIESSRSSELEWSIQSSYLDHSVTVLDSRPDKTVSPCKTKAFGILSPMEHMWLSERTTEIVCESGRVFYRPDEPSEAVFVLKHGKVSRYRMTPEGRKIVVATLESPAIFGGMSSIDHGTYGCFAEAATHCHLCVLSRSDLQSLVRRNPDIGLRLLAELGKRLEQREEALESLAFRSLPARLAGLLLAEENDCGEVVGLSHQDLAERLGTYRETVSQMLGRFRHEGLIAVGQRHIRILDHVGLNTYRQE